MKKVICLALIVLCFTGCNQNDSMDEALALRSRLIGAGCTFQAQVTADYGDQIWNFMLECVMDSTGNLHFTVQSPKSISGIRGSISASGGKLEFDDTALAFPLLADGQLSPVSAPYILIKALIGGYITSAGQDGSYQRVTICDQYEEDALTVDVWLDGGTPVQAEILWDNRRILTIQVGNFVIE